MISLWIYPLIGALTQAGPDSGSAVATPPRTAGHLFIVQAETESGIIRVGRHLEQAYDPYRRRVDATYPLRTDVVILR